LCRAESRRIGSRSLRPLDQIVPEISSFKGAQARDKK
jgi:hypothetical protein